MDLFLRLSKRGTACDLRLERVAERKVLSVVAGKKLQPAQTTLRGEPFGQQLDKIIIHLLRIYRFFLPAAERRRDITAQPRPLDRTTTDHDPVGTGKRECAYRVVCTEDPAVDEVRQRDRLRDLSSLLPAWTATELLPGPAGVDRQQINPFSFEKAAQFGKYRRPALRSKTDLCAQRQFGRRAQPANDRLQAPEISDKCRPRPLSALLRGRTAEIEIDTGPAEAMNRIDRRSHQCRIATDELVKERPLLITLMKKR